MKVSCNGNRSTVEGVQIATLCGGPVTGNWIGLAINVGRVCPVEGHVDGQILLHVSIHRQVITIRWVGCDARLCHNNGPEKARTNYVLIITIGQITPDPACRGVISLFVLTSISRQDLRLEFFCIDGKRCFV